MTHDATYFRIKRQAEDAVIRAEFGADLATFVIMEDGAPTLSYHIICGWQASILDRAEALGAQLAEISGKRGRAADAKRLTAEMLDCIADGNKTIADAKAAWAAYRDDADRVSRVNAAIAAAVKAATSRHEAETLAALAERAKALQAKAAATLRLPTPDEAAGMAWWNGMDDAARAVWIKSSADGSPAGAWAVYKEWKAVGDLSDATPQGTA